jgi:asparagine synthase (glutamine-hydrolysing)
MATISGILCSDGSVPSERMVARLAARTASSKGSPVKVRHAGHVVLMSTPVSESPESRFDSDAPHTILTLDGRVDNRSDLLGRSSVRLPHTCTDADLIRAHLADNGIQGLRHVVGEWSLALWDPSDRTLSLASDYLGIRPLYYRLIRDGFCWSSSMEALLDLEPDTLDTDWLAAELSFSTPPEATPYRSIRYVPAGHCLTVASNGDRSLHEHYDFSYSALTKSSDDDYIEQLRSLLIEAVEVRLRSAAPAWILLSGGLDSSAIYCLADRLVSAGAVQTRTIRTFSFTSRQSKEGDETRFIRALTDGRGWDVHESDIDDDPELTYSKTSPYPVMGIQRAMLRSVDRDPGATVFSGRLGDTVMGNFVNYSYSLATLLARYQPLRFARDARRWAHETRQTFWRVCAQGTAMMLPAEWRRQMSFKRLLQKHATLMGGSRRITDAFCLPDRFEESIRSQYSAYELLTRHWPDPGRRYVLGFLYHYRELRTLQPPPSMPFLRYSYPYAHRPLVEFVLSMPHSQLCPPGTPRAAMKAALTNVLPPRIRNRIGKGYATPAVARQLREPATRLRANVRDLHLVSLGLIDSGKLATRLEKFLAGSITDIGNLTRIIYMEDWLAFLDSGARVDSADTPRVESSRRQVHA